MVFSCVMAQGFCDVACKPALPCPTQRNVWWHAILNTAHVGRTAPCGPHSSMWAHTTPCGSPWGPSSLCGLHLLAAGYGSRVGLMASAVVGCGQGGVVALRTLTRWVW